MLSTERKRGGHGRKVYMDTFTRYLSEAAIQLIGQVRTYKQIWEPEEMQFLPDILRGTRKRTEQGSLRQSRRARRIVWVLSVNLIFMTAETE